MTDHAERMLLLLRHGKALSDGGDDHRRPLKSRGVDDSRAIGQWLVDNDLQPELTLVSDAKRTWQTYQNVVSQLDTPGHCSAQRSLYLANALEIADEIATVSSKIRTLLVIGHNPGLENLASSLSEQTTRMKSGTLVALNLRGTWRDLIPARVEQLHQVRGKDL